ncbi:SRPBCC family protein [Parasulfitobacter algicola]|uniref:SRPBCC family protein n=1 Tax=Parasulfitobacter algicola TaxID=2614809 RepID=A0ABX2ISV1_9RHOB|nr:SRPBCC family protein [Sulfitobacter algicola]NSX55992.1 SRPBCC family protein [Sulfitobacter algicola]
MRKFLLGGLILIGLAIGILAWTTQPPKVPPVADMPPALPELTTMETFTASTLLPGTPQDARAFMQDKTILVFLQAGNGIPAVTGFTAIDGDFPDQGATRRVEIEGGHYVVERVLNTSATAFQYQVWNYTNFAKLLVSQSVGQFTFEAQGDQTLMSWTYYMEPTHQLTRPLLANFLETRFGPYMQAGLDRFQTAYMTQ